MFRCLLSLLLFIPLFVSAQRIRPFPVLPNGKPKYEYIYPSEYGFHMVKGKDGKMGCIDRNFRVVVPAVYEHLEWFSQGVLKVTSDCKGSPSDCKYGLIDTNGVILLPCISAYITNYPEDFYRMPDRSRLRPCTIAMYNHNRDTTFLLNLITRQQLVFPFSFDFGRHPVGSKFIVYKRRKYGAALVDGTIVAPLKYNSIGSCEEGRINFTLEGKHGFFDTFFHEVIPAVYQNVLSFSNGLAAVRQNDKWGFIDRSGKIVVDFLYDSVSHFISGFAAVKLNGRWGRINKLGRVVNAMKYDKFPSQSSYHNWNGQVAVILSGKMGVVDSTDNFIIPLRDAEIWDWHPFWEIRSKGRFALRSIFSEVTSPYLYTETRSLGYKSGDIAVSDTNGNWFWMDSQAHIVPTPSFTSEKDLSLYYNLYMDSVNWPNHDRDINFTDGLAPLANYMHKYGYIDTNRNLVIPYQFTSAEHFQDGKARVNFDSLTGVINTQGKYIEPLTRITYPCIGGVRFTSCRKKIGLIDASGKEVIPCVYDELDYTSDGLVHAMLNGKCGYFDTLGNNPVLLIYDIITPFNEGRMAACFTTCWTRRNQNEPYRLDTAKNVEVDLLSKESHYTYSWKLLDRSGAIRFTFDSSISDVSIFSGGLAGAKDTSGKYGFIDTLGKMVIPFIYSEAKSFVNGEAPVCYSVYNHFDSNTQTEYTNLWGVIDTKGRWIIPPTYQDIDIFSNKVPIVVSSSFDSRALVDRKNRMLTPYMFTSFGFRRSLASNELICLIFGDQKLVPDKRGKLRLYKEEKK